MKAATRVFALAVAGIALAGCATPSGGTAMQVNGARVSLRDLDRSADDCARLTKSTKDAVRGGVANMYLQGLIAEQLAARDGLTITDADRTAQATKDQATPLMDGGACQQAVTKWLSIRVLENKMSAEDIIAQAKQLNIQVNPQFGPYKADSIGLPGGSGSLSTGGTTPLSAK